MKNLKCTGHMTNPQLVEDLICKLPPSLRMQWGIAAASMGQEEPNLKEFSAWLEEMAFAASFIPVPSSTTRDSYKERERTQEKIKGFTPPARSPVFSVTSNGGKSCDFCSCDGHWLTSCEKFRALDPAHKRKWIKEAQICFACLQSGHRAKHCRKKRTCGIRGCEKTHHKLLHAEEDEDQTAHVGLQATCTASTACKTGNVAVNLAKAAPKVLLRVMPVTVSGPKGSVGTYAIFDEGSTVSLMETRLASEVGAEGIRDPLRLSWIHNSHQSEKHSKRVTVDVRGSQSTCTYKLENVRTVSNLALPLHTLDVKQLQHKWTHLKNTDVESMVNAKPRLLIGQDNCHLIVPREVIEGPSTAPVLTRSLLGWTIHGNNGLYKGRVDEDFIFHTWENPDEELHQLVKTSFSTDNFGVVPPRKPIISKEEERAWKIMETTTRRVGERWETGLLWKDDNVSLPDSYEMAKKRLLPVEKQMKQDETFCTLYQNKIQEYVEKGYARKLTSDQIRESPKTWYIPHFAVYNVNKPGKIRLVFDAAARSRGFSLNDALLPGPDLLTPLIGVLFKFRQREIGFIGDIQEMFHRVLIREEDKVSQRFLWRDGDSSRAPDIYQMDAMIFGSTCSPASAQFVKNKNAAEFEDEFPDAVQAIQNRVYVDDYFDSAHTPEEAIERIKSVAEVNRRGGFNIRNWMCTSAAVLNTVPQHLRSLKNQTNISAETERVLGVSWNAETDCFTFLLNFAKIPAAIVDGSKNPTKREMLRVIMSLFDPLGFITNFTVAAKILVQDVWRIGLGWDDEINGDTLKKWKIWMHSLGMVRNLKIPRCYSENMMLSYRNELHVFTDASEKAFAAVAYIKVFTEVGVDISFLMAKSRVSPLRPMTIPRLELQAAVLGSRLAETIRKHHEIKFDAVHYWTDSYTVLRWLRSDTRQYKQFVAFRIGEILETTEVSNWYWVPTKENPADDATRDTTAMEMTNSSRWLQGPAFLKMEEKDWPREKMPFVADETDEVRQSIVLTLYEKSLDHLPDVERFSSWIKLLRVTAWILRFIHNSRNKDRRKGTLSVEEVHEAELQWIIASQTQSFPEEIQNLRMKKKISKASSLFKVDPILDKRGLLRLTGRLENANLPMNTKNPIILDGNHKYTKLLLHHYHVKFNHCGMESVTNELRQSYWIIKVRMAVRRTWSECQVCKNRRTKTLEPKMGNLPPVRIVRSVRPFISVGMDYFGPILVKNQHKRDKRYGVLFTCMVTCAVHLEMATSLSTDSCLLAIRRMIARRGFPKDIYSDNGTNLRGSQAELKNAIKKLQQSDIQNFLTAKEIKWHFSPPTCPHFGGAWERLIRSIKNTMQIVMKNIILTDEMLTTIFSEAESLVNSSPLTFVSLDHQDEEALTPNHFLLGSSSPATCPVIFDNVLVSMKQWKHTQQTLDHFWRRWTKEYLPSLTRKTKWILPSSPIAVGSIVVIADPSLPRGCWPKGLVTRTFPGKDGVTRVVDVKTQFGTFRRPVSKLCPLDVHKK